ncbi:MAG: hypothetical protein V4582_09080 [Pseudomonadota bacterium]
MQDQANKSFADCGAPAAVFDGEWKSGRAGSKAPPAARNNFSKSIKN